MKTKKSAFTLVEVMVVIAIIIVLAAVLFPVFARAKKSAIADSCRSNLKQIAYSLNMYMTDNNEMLPISLKVFDDQHISRRCPLDMSRYLYNAGITAWSEINHKGIPIKGFDETKNAAVKCPSHNDWNGPTKSESSREQLPDKTKITVTYEVPVVPLGADYRVLGGFLDGHVGWTWLTDDWQKKVNN